MEMPKYLKSCLRVIQMECDSHDNCDEGCPFMKDLGFGFVCGIKLNDEIPCCWPIDTMEVKND